MMNPSLTKSSSRVIADKDADTESISVRAVRKEFRRRGGASVLAVADVSLSVTRGQMLVLLGPSGCGKTSLLRCIAGLERPDSGEITIDGETVFSTSRGINRPPNVRNIGMMFQSYALWPHMTVGANVAYALKGRSLSKNEIRSRVSAILERMGVGGLGEQYPGRLSGGQQQRVALARTLVTSPRVILFDEPLSNVDARIREELRVELMTMQRDLGFTGVYVTHDQIEALQLADRLAVLNAGRIVQLSDSESVYSRPASLTAARFVGTLNEMAGTLTAAHADGMCEVQCEVGLIRGRDHNDVVRQHAPGTPVVVGVRAEAFYLARESAPPSALSNVCSGRVVAKGFAGPYRVDVIRAGGSTLTIHTPPAALRGTGRQARVGEAIDVYFSPDDTMVFAD